MKVTKQERELLIATRDQLQARSTPFRKAKPFVMTEHAVESVKDMPNKHFVGLLAYGGWKQQKYMRDGKPKLGRIWERTEDLSLHFNCRTIRKVTGHINDGHYKRKEWGDILYEWWAGTEDKTDNPLLALSQPTTASRVSYSMDLWPMEGLQEELRSRLPEADRR